jgi:hypothetical protein
VRGGIGFSCGEAAAEFICKESQPAVSVSSLPDKGERQSVIIGHY